MTRKQENGQPPTEFSAWLREQREIDSDIGYRTYNIDYLWTRDGTDKFLLIEEKRHMGQIKEGGRRAFKKILSALQNNKNFLGFFLIRFENTCPDDGKIYISQLTGSWQQDFTTPEREISKEDLIYFLKLEWIND